MIDPCEPSALSDLDDAADDLVRRKAALRTPLLARRRAIEAGEAVAAAAAVAERVAGLIPREASVVAAYWPLEDELDPRPAMRLLSGHGHRLVLPRMRGKALPLAFHAFEWDQPLTQGGFGVMQPGPEAPLATPDVVLVPLLAFDRQGHRLGYGQGYYDRTLRALRAAGSLQLALGLAFARQEIDAVPAGPSDEPLDAVLTERASHRRSPARPA